MLESWGITPSGPAFQLNSMPENFLAYKLKFCLFALKVGLCLFQKFVSISEFFCCSIPFTELGCHGMFGLANMMNSSSFWRLNSYTSAYLIWTTSDHSHSFCGMKSSRNYYFCDSWATRDSEAFEFSRCSSNTRCVATKDSCKLIATRAGRPSWVWREMMCFWAELNSDCSCSALSFFCTSCSWIP